MGLSNRTSALLARPFEGGGGPSHSTIELIWMTADAADYLPDAENHNKLNRVLGGLRALQGGRPAPLGSPAIPPDETKLRLVAADLSTRLMAFGLVDEDQLEAAFARDGLELTDGELRGSRPDDEPADRLAAHLTSIFGDRPELNVAKEHYRQASEAFDRGHWEAANSQFRSAFDATFDALAATLGCPPGKTGGAARKWLQEHGHLVEDEANLTKAFMGFASRNGSHAGLSGAAEAQLRRHFATALMVFAVAKLDE